MHPAHALQHCCLQSSKAGGNTQESGCVTARTACKQEMFGLVLETSRDEQKACGLGCEQQHGQQASVTSPLLQRSGQTPPK